MRCARFIDQYWGSSRGLLSWAQALNFGKLENTIRMWFSSLCLASGGPQITSIHINISVPFNCLAKFDSSEISDFSLLALACKVRFRLQTGNISKKRRHD